MAETTSSLFDYTNFDSDTAQFVQQKLGEIQGFWRQTLHNVVEIGRCLTEVKTRIGHGNFENWLKAEFAGGLWSARKSMQVYEKFKSVNFTDLPIDPSAAYILAAPSTSEAIFDQAIERAQAGETVTHKFVQGLKNQDRYISPSPQPETQTKEEAPPRLEHKPSQLQPSFQVPLQPATQYLPRIDSTLVTPTFTKRRRAKEEKAVVVAAKRVQPGDWWKLGKDSSLYCGDSLSEEFQRSLPEPVSFSLAFPPTDRWHLDYLSSKMSKALSSLVLHTVFVQDQDLSLFREGIEKFFQIYTEGGELVVLSFLPDPAILSLIDQLDCRFICADPDPKRCDAALTVWTAIGQSAEKMLTRQGGKKRLSSPALVK